MTVSQHCGRAAHEAMKLTDEFSRGPFLGFQVVEDDNGPVDVAEVRDCPRCGCTLQRSLGVEARLAAAREAHGGNGDQYMIGLCKRALHPDPMTGKQDDSAIRSFVEVMRFEACLPGVAVTAEREKVAS